LDLEEQLKSYFAAYHEDTAVSIVPMYQNLHYFTSAIIYHDGTGTILEMNSENDDHGVVNIETFSEDSWQSRVSTLWNKLWIIKGIPNAKISKVAVCKVKSLIV